VLSIVSITITGTNSGDFSQTSTCGTTVAPEANCTISVTFRPTAANTRTASLTITDSASNSPQKVTLSGTGTYVSLLPASLSFGNQKVRTTSSAETITLTNTNASALSITSIKIGGTNNGDFAQTNTCGTSVAAGASCIISVTFTPLEKGARSAAVNITDSGGGSPQSVPVSGTGQ
jgi:hypothetical protein